jgi:uncharacterized protein involved in type VI secretion and phage assembly
MSLLDSTPARATGRIYGVVVGTVTDNKDPESLSRVKVTFPWLGDDPESNWAPVATLMAGKEMGLFFLPEVGDTVLCAFEHGDVRYPYVVGSLYNGKEPPPETNSDGKNNRRVLISRSGMAIRFDDTSGSEKITISDKDDKNVVLIDVANGKISLSVSSGDIELKAPSGKVTIEGQDVEIKASASGKFQAASGLDLKCDGTTNLKGATVNIN